MAQVILIPIHWRLHLLAQSVTVLYYFIVNPLLGLNQLPGTTGLFSLENITHALLICLVSNIAAFLYDRLQQREFESRRELRLFIHAVTHDLRIPVIGTSIVLQKLLRKAQAADGQTTITAPKLEQLLDGSDRQLNLINSILEAHTSETQGITLHCQPLQLSTLVASVLVDADALLHQNQIQLNNRITDDLPLIQADGNHLCRVFNNLITNALTHNPSGIQLTLAATLLKPNMLYCTIQDTGIGIPLQQQSRLFEIYYRGEQSRYMPGLGLGLYLCHQIITAHGGKIGVISQPGKGATFWFTLPVVADKGHQAVMDESSLNQTRSEGDYRSLYPVIH
jgi:signal transduction histidine kinase